MYYRQWCIIPPINKPEFFKMIQFIFLFKKITSNNQLIVLFIWLLFIKEKPWLSSDKINILIFKYKNFAFPTFCSIWDFLFWFFFFRCQTWPPIFQASKAGAKSPLYIRHIFKKVLKYHKANFTNRYLNWYHNNFQAS